MKILTGQTFGKLLVIAYLGDRTYKSTTTRHRMWLCVCDCGKTSVALANNLSRGVTKSCGCGSGKWTHGMSRSKGGRRLYSVWCSMWSRCRSNNPGYGGRGITVCDRWRSFENFYADMGPRPEGLTLERKDVNGHYCPENCIWADRVTQSNNTTKTRYINYNGQRLPLAIVHRHATTPITLGAFWIRIRNGWSVERALRQPVEFRRPRRTHAVS